MSKPTVYSVVETKDGIGVVLCVEENGNYYVRSIDGKCNTYANVKIADVDVLDIGTMTNLGPIEYVDGQTGLIYYRIGDLYCRRNEFTIIPKYRIGQTVIIDGYVCLIDQIELVDGKFVYYSQQDTMEEKDVVPCNGPIYQVGQTVVTKDGEGVVTRVKAATGYRYVVNGLSLSENEIVSVKP